MVIERDVYDQLAMSAANGNQEAAAELFNRLNRFLVWYCGSSDSENKHDLSQDVWVKVFSKIGSYEPRGRFVAWLKKVARNHLIDSAREKKKSVLSEAISSGQFDVNHYVDHNQNSDLDPEFRETAAICRDALESTQGTKLECFKLHYLHGISIKDIAMWSNKPLPTIKSRVRLAIRDVRGAIESKHAGLVRGE